MNNNCRNITYDMLPPDKWHRQLEDIGLGKCNPPLFHINEQLGNGAFTYMIFQKGFWAQQLEFQLKEQWNITLRPLKDIDTFYLNFYLTNNNITLVFEAKNYTFNYDNFSLLLSYSATNIQYIVPAFIPIKIFKIGFTKDWIKDNLGESNNEALNTILNNEKAIFFQESVSYKFKRLVLEMDLYKSDKLLLISHSMRILRKFFENLSNRAFDKIQNTKIHNDDYQNLKLVIAILDKNPLEKHPINELAQQAKMSQSKFKRLFKLVTGESPYQYQLRQKLTVAMDLLLDEKYNIGEVAEILGYSNTGKFSKAFKKQFNILPSQVH